MILHKIKQIKTNTLTKRGYNSTKETFYSICNTNFIGKFVNDEDGFIYIKDFDDSILDRLYDKFNNSSVRYTTNINGHLENVDYQL